MSESTNETIISSACGCAMQYVGRNKSSESGYYCSCATSNAVNFDHHSMRLEIDRLEEELAQTKGQLGNKMLTNKALKVKRDELNKELAKNKDLLAHAETDRDWAIKQRDDLKEELLRSVMYDACRLLKGKNKEEFISIYKGRIT